MDGLISDYLLHDQAGASLRDAGVLFIEDFDEPAFPRPGAQADILAPTYTADDLEAAREDGRLAALEDHAAVHAALVQAALTSVGEALAATRAQAVAASAAQAEEIAGGVLAMLAACLPATAARVAADEIRALAAVLLPPLAREPGVAVRLHPDVLPGLAPELARLGDFRVSADASLHVSDVAVTWRDGEARRDWAQVWAGIVTALSAFALPQDLALVREAPGDGQ